MLNKLAISTVLSLGLGFAPAAFAERTQAQIQHDKDCASLKASYNEVLAHAKLRPKNNRRWFLSAYNIKLIAEEKKCSWTTQA